MRLPQDPPPAPSRDPALNAESAPMRAASLLGSCIILAAFAVIGLVVWVWMR
jgi:hypothetical protein